MLDLRRLHTLRVLREKRTVTATAQALLLTPSAVSQQLRQLARDVGVELLHHEGRRVTLTPAAHILLEHGDTIAEVWERCRADLTEHAEGAVGEIRVAAFESIFDSLLTPAADQIGRSHPRLTVTLVETSADDAMSRLLAGQIDIAVLPVSGTPPSQDPRFDQQTLLEDPQDLIVPAGHSLAQRVTVRLAEAANEPWIAPHSDQRMLIDVACASAGFTPRYVHHVLGWSVAMTLVGRGLGVCLLPRLLVVGSDCDIVRIPIAGAPRPTREILTCVRRGARNAPAVSAVLRAVEREAQRHGRRS